MVNPDKKASVEKKEVIAYVVARFSDRLLPKDGKREHVCDAMACIEVYRSKLKEK